MAKVPSNTVFNTDFTKIEQVIALATKMADGGPSQYIYWNGKNYNITMQYARVMDKKYVKIQGTKGD